MYAGLHNETYLFSGDISWMKIRYAINNFYPDFWPTLQINGLFGFYSSNSVCLPQIFVTVSICL